MSQLTNFGENKLIDKMRGTEPPYPSTNWYVALASAANDATFTEITGVDLPRVAIGRSKAAWAATNGPGTTVDSTGTSHATSNNADIDFAAAASDRGIATHIGLFDASTGGNCWIWTPLPAPVTVNSGVAPVINAGDIMLTLGIVGGMSDFLSNELIDEVWRGQAYAWPASTYPRLYTTPATRAGGGTEVAGGAYSRPEVASTATEWSGTQSSGSTGASSGTSGRSSNNNAVTFPEPTGADWGDIKGDGIGDAPTGGNLLWFSDYTVPGGPGAKTVSDGGMAPSWAPNTLGVTLD